MFSNDDSIADTYGIKEHQDCIYISKAGCCDGCDFTFETETATETARIETETETSG